MPASLKSLGGVSSHNHDERDALIRKRTIALLRLSGYPALEGLDCQVADGVIELTGIVPSFYLKQVAQAVASRVEKAYRVRNQVQVIAAPLWLTS